MIVTKEQQEALVDKYLKAKPRNSTEECIAFIDGINATLELMDEILSNEL